MINSQLKQAIATILKNRVNKNNFGIFAQVQTVSNRALFEIHQSKINITDDAIFQGDVKIANIHRRFSSKFDRTLFAYRELAPIVEYL